MAEKLLKTKNLKHFPTLNTVLMVENVLKKGELMTISEIKRKLPKQVMNETLIQILDYLQNIGKIMIGTKGILWIFTESKKLEKMIKAGIEV